MYRSLVLILAFGLSACASVGTNTVAGTAGGTVIGAGLGAIIGSATGHAGPGIAIGSGIGAATGALIGQALDSQVDQREAQQQTLEQQRLQIEENRRLIDELRNRGADARLTDRGVVINLPDVLFEFDRSDLTADANNTVTEISGVLKDSTGRNISIEGHTDSIGDVVYNQRLSESRARSVARDLERNGVPSRQMTVRGMGEGQPIASNNSDAGRARNRRVEVIIEN